MRKALLIAICAVLTGLSFTGQGLAQSSRSGSGDPSIIDGGDNRHPGVRPRPRPQRFICVVEPRPSDNRNRPYVCRTNEGRVGGTCRCSGVVGTGQRQPA